MNDSNSISGSEEGLENGYGRLERVRRWLNSAETIYLEVLRAAALVIATIVLLWIGWLLLSSTYKVAQDADEVVEQEASVSAAETIDIPTPGDADSPQRANSAGTSNSESSETRFERFRADYYQLYQNAFESYKQDDDDALNEEQFEALYLIDFEGTGSGSESDYWVGQNDFPDLLETMRNAAELPTTIERLSTYRDTPKVRREEPIRRTRQERYCASRYTYSGRCYYYDTRTVRYTETRVTMVPPEGVLDHQQLFAAYQSNYLDQLSSEREEFADVAAQERGERRAANAEGWAGFEEALTYAAGFLAIMFLFLVIAIERHQRRMARELLARD